MKWEYNVIAGIAENGIIHEKGTSTSWNHPSFVEMLNAHGDMGWELVDLEHISKKVGFICTFKRPIED